MSVLCCRIPDFLISLTYRQQPQWVNRPLALLAADETVCAVSVLAQRQGVQVAMRPRQAQTYCPDLALVPLETASAQAEQAALLAALTAWELPVEELGWGAAYLDLHTLARRAADVQPLADELGKRVRQLLGASLTPSLGWDSGKFTAHAAAQQAAPGHMRLVPKAEEAPFLANLPIALLPLSAKALQELYWLGIRTLGQYGKLPAVGVWQRWGQAGKLAQRWAQGRDERPVRPTVQNTPAVIELDLDPPSDRLPPVLAVALTGLKPPLQTLADQLAGCQRLRLQLDFVAGETRTVDIALVEPVCQAASLEGMLTHQLRTLVWPGEVSRLRLTLLETVELPARQLTLFPEQEAQPKPLTELARRFTGKYGQLFLQGQLADATHPLAERRCQFQLLA
jgi:nucleotidyltransferase/DNA polymerase involved in DNA repair